MTYTRLPCPLVDGVCLVAKSCLTLANPWTVSLQDPLSMGFLRQEYWSGFLTQGLNPEDDTAGI